ncbi:MAG: GTP-dependent dephospho-CoA kinase family protein [Candidatus Heimdallarchaeota archaeon]
MRKELSIPMGQLITEEPTQQLLRKIEEEKPQLVIMIGDYCTQDVISHGYVPDLAIIDGLNLREPFQEVMIPNAKIIKANNPPAVISKESWMQISNAIKDILTKKESKSNVPIILSITGEEDLLVFPVVLEAPEGAFIIYGQPHEGIVLINVTPNVKFKFKKLIERMKVE